VPAQFINQFRERDEHGAALVLALLGTAAETRCEPVEQHERRHQKQRRTHQSIAQQVDQMIPRTDHRRIGIEHDDG
jgi:hypothetical protein